MLQFFRENMQGTMAKIIIAIIIVPFALFGVESFISNSGANDAASVNGEPVTISELTRAMQVRKNNILAQMGENADPAALTDDIIRGPVLNMLIEQELLRQAAAEMGVAVGENALDMNIVNTESFQVEGKFSAERYRSLLASNGLSPVGYKNMLREDLEMRQLIDGITNTSFVSSEELAVAARYVGETRTIEYVTLPMAEAIENVSVSDEEVATFYNENADKFQTQESVVLDYILVNRDDFSPDISDEDVRAEYQRQIDKMESGVSRGAAHIMLEIGDRSEADAIASLNEIKAKIDAGADFAEMAAQYSEDSFSAQQGGDIGDTTGDIFPEEFENTLAMLDIDQVSQPVVVDGTAHLIKLVRLQELEKPTFEEKYDEIKSQLAIVEAEPRYIATLDQLADMSFNSVGLQDTAEELKLSLSRSDKITQAGAGGIFENKKLLTAAFSDELVNQGHNSEVIEISATQSVVIRVAEHFPPMPRALEEVAASIKSRIANQKATQNLETRAQSMITSLKEGQSFATLANEFGLNVELLDNVDRRGATQPRIVNAAFSLAVDDVGFETVSMGMQGLAVLRVSNVIAGDIATMTEQDVNGLRGLLQQSSANADFSSYQASLRSNANVKLL